MMTQTTLRVADDAIAATSTLKPATIADKVGIWLDTLSRGAIIIFQVTICYDENG